MDLPNAAHRPWPLPHRPWVLAMQHRLGLRAMASVIAPYPTLGEIGKRAAGNFYAPRLFSAGTRRLVRLLQRLP